MESKWERLKFRADIYRRRKQSGFKSMTFILEDFDKIAAVVDATILHNAKMYSDCPLQELVAAEKQLERALEALEK